MTLGGDMSDGGSDVIVGEPGCTLSHQLPIHSIPIAVRIQIPDGLDIEALARSVSQAAKRGRHA